MNWFSKGYRDSFFELKRKRRRDLFNLLFVWFLVPLLLVACLVFVCRSYERAMIEDLESMQLEKLRLQAEQEDLKQEISDLSSRKRIYRYATEKLRMKYPGPDDIVLVVFEEPADSPEGRPPREEGGRPTDYAMDRNGEGSLINVLTQFFALYVF